MVDDREPDHDDAHPVPGDRTGPPPSSDELIRRARNELDPTPGRAEGAGAGAAPSPPVAAAETEPASPPHRAGESPDPFGRPGPGDRVPVGPLPGIPQRGRRNPIVGLLVGAAVVAGLAAAAVTIFGGDEERPRPNAAVEATREALSDVGVRETSIDCVVEQLENDGAFATLDDVNPKVLDDFELSGVGMPREIVPFMAAFVETLPACLSATELQAFATAPATEGPQTLGDSPELDELWNSCGAGDYEACDLLYIVSPVGSDYEAFGGGCGDREADVALPCVVVLGAGPDLDGWEQRCDAGDFGACDLLFSLSAVGSDQERFGATCGNRNEASDVLPLPCTMRYGLGNRP